VKGEAPIVEPMDTRRIWWSDLGLTALLVSAGLVGTGGAAANQGQTAPTTSYVLMLAACLPIAVSRRWPAWAAALTGAATVAYVGLGYAYGPIIFALVVAVYRLAAGTPVRPALAGAAVLMCAGLGAVAARTGAGQPDWSDFVAAAACFAVPAAVGVAVKVRRDAAVDVRAEQSRRAVSEQRLLLAQEVHDVVGHGLAVIAIQAGAALRVLERDPARARQALEAIRAASKDALDGMRAELAALREPGRPGPAPLRPATGLTDLPALAARIRSSGLPVAVEIDGTVSGLGLPAEADRSAYRIIQESLTNVLRHGGPGATARVRVEVDAGALRLEVTDTGRGVAPAPSAGGQGIDGMRARAAALGGSLEAGPRPEGGFAVRARLPVPDRVAAPGERP
jgi:signal transduction histidine kinase